MNKLLHWLFRQSRVDEELSQELQSHIEMRAELNRESGMPADEALRAARRRFGNTTRIHEDARSYDVNVFIETIGQDLQYAFRGLRKHPIFAFAAVITLALGIGATTAVFSVVDLILFRDLPYKNSDRLVSIGAEVDVPGAYLGSRQEFLFAGTYLRWRKQQTAFESITSWAGTSDPFGGDATDGCDLTDNEPARLTCAFVAASFLPTFGVEPVFGHNFSAKEDLDGAAAVALVSYKTWAGRFAGDPTIVGRSISLNGKPVQIIGVLPKEFELPTLDEFDLLRPQAFPEARWNTLDSGRQVWAFARLKPRGNLAQAKLEMQPLFSEFVQAAPPNFRKDIKLTVRSLRDRQIGDARLASWVLFGAVLLVLLLASANVANLLLTRAVSRQDEVAVRSALGASRVRLIRQSLTESLVLGMFGSVGGCAIANAALHLFRAVASEGILRLNDAHIDMRVLGFALFVSVGSAILFGIVPAMRSPASEHMSGWRVVGSRRPITNLLIACQIAICIVLLSGAGLLLRTLSNLQRIPLGVDADNVTLFTVVLGPQRYPGLREQNGFFDQLEQRLLGASWASVFSISDSVPLGAAARSNPMSFVQVEGQSTLMDGIGGAVVNRVVTPGYFSAMGIPVIAGRPFQKRDRVSAQNAIVLNQMLARSLFGLQEPLGKRIRFGGRGPTYEVIGVVGNVRNRPIFDDNRPEYYLVRRPPPDPAALQRHGYGRAATVTIRSTLPAARLREQLRAIVASLDPSIPVTVETLNSRAERLTTRPRFNAWLVTAFAAAGLLLAAVGLYGVLSFLVTQRTKEIGVRIALGARNWQVIRLVLAHATVWVSIGVITGLAGSVAAAHGIESMLYGVSEYDLNITSLAVGVLLIVACLAAMIPSWRASRIDPLQALRHD